MKITKIGPLGLQLIKDSEGFSAKPYLCPAGVWTVGFGTTRYPNSLKVSELFSDVTIAEAEHILKLTLKTYEDAVDEFCPDNLNQNQFDALVSFTYNVGVQAFKNSTLLKKIKANSQDPTIATEFQKWNKGGGRVLKGLAKRRLAEANLYFL